uniref:Uncharacterized protein n=1 Tax=Panagrolaimus superbus TaxID=310955 RepID=A0A914ZFN8_9BILA
MSLYSAFYDEVELISQWKQKKYFKHVQFHHLFAGLYPKLIAEFVEEKLDSDSSIEIIYHPEITKIEIDFFQKSLIKWMNKVSADWAMVGHYGPKKKLLIKLGNGSGDKKFDEKCLFIF